jgi:hypothetical protein
VRERALEGVLDQERQLEDGRVGKVARRVAHHHVRDVGDAVAHQLELLHRVAPQRAAREQAHVHRALELVVHLHHPGPEHVLVERAGRRREAREFQLGDLRAGAHRKDERARDQELPHVGSFLHSRTGFHSR